jgi:uncharacterized protein
MKISNSSKPDIQYPCRWQFRLIGESREAILDAIHTSVDIAACEIAEGNASSSGRYLSLNLELTVNDEAERLQFYQVLSKHPAIRVVL